VCSLYLLIDIIQEIYNKTITIEDLKNTLIDEYLKLSQNYTNKTRVDKLIDILKEEHQLDVLLIEEGVLNFERMIIHDGFKPVNFDIWILLVHYKIPSIFLSHTLINETRFNRHEFVCYSDSDTTKYVFIVVPAMFKRPETNIPKYKIILNNNKKMLISLTSMQKHCNANITTALESITDIEHYIDTLFTKYMTTKYKPKKKGVRQLIELIEEDSVPEQLPSSPKPNLQPEIERPPPNNVS